MRTESSTSGGSTATRIRENVTRARRWVGRLGRAARFALIAIAATALAAFVYLAIPLDRDETLWLYDGRKFSRDGAIAIQKALAAEKIEYVVDQSKRIGVSASRWAAAFAALEKHGVEPASLEGIHHELEVSSLMETPAARAEKQHRAKERELKVVIEGYEGIRSADVTINRTLVRGGFHPTYDISSLVILEVEHEPSSRVVNSIQTLLSSKFPGLRSDSISISDQSGRFYVAAGNPTIAIATQSRARAEEFRDALLENLAPLISGLDLVVQVEPPAAISAEPPASSRTSKVATAPLFAPASEEIRPNGPLVLEPEPAPATAPPAIPASAPMSKANVWVKIPRSYYLRIFRENGTTRQPSADDLAPYHQKTRELIDNAVAVVIPEAERGRVLMNTILDDLEAAGTLGTSPASDSHRARPAWVVPAAIGAGVGLGVALIFGTGFGVLAARRPSSKSPKRSTVRSGLTVDPPSGPVPGPSERVRDLVRRDPQAAAGVLQRWIGQGEGGTDE